MELTVPFEMNINKAHTRKMERYGSLVTDLNHIAGYNVQLLCVEIGSKGLITQDNKGPLQNSTAGRPPATGGLRAVDPRILIYTISMRRTDRSSLLIGQFAQEISRVNVSKSEDEWRSFTYTIAV